MLFIIQILDQENYMHLYRNEQLVEAIWILGGLSTNHGVGVPFPLYKIPCMESFRENETGNDPNCIPDPGSFVVSETCAP